MTNWKRLIIGDAFHRSSGGFDHYRDRFLMWPFLLFSIVAIANVFATNPADRRYAIKAAACAGVAILLAKERLIMLLAALAYVALRLAVAVVFHPDWTMLLTLLLSCGLIIAIFRFSSVLHWKPKFADEEGIYSLDLIVGVCGLGAAIGLAVWMRP